VPAGQRIGIQRADAVRAKLAELNLGEATGDKDLLDIPDKKSFMIVSRVIESPRKIASAIHAGNSPGF
jgi:hypothetical protein